MTSEELEELADVSKALLYLRKELERYQVEEHLSQETRNPWIVVTVGNHPTYLSEFKVKIRRLGARAQIKKIMLAETRFRIKGLEAKLKVLKGK